LDVPSVTIENYQGAYRVGQVLAEMGHKRVAFVAPMRLQVINERLNGFRDALLDAGVLFDRSLVVDLGGEGMSDFLTDRVGSSTEVIAGLLARPDRPTAIFDASGDVAVQVYRAARQAGLSIPGDLSVVTFEDAPLFQALEPEIARLRHPWLKVGSAAMEMLVPLMDRKGAGRGACEHRALGAEWLAGKSIAECGLRIGE
jgi:LacI family transcriptional regulator